MFMTFQKYLELDCFKQTIDRYIENIKSKNVA